MWFCRVLKRIDQIVVRLKAIKYKVDVVCYLSSYPSSLGIEPSHQTSCLQTLSLIKHIHPNLLGFQIRSNNLNSRSLSLSLTSMPNPSWQHWSYQLLSQRSSWQNLVCKMTPSLTRNCKAIRKNPNLNGIELRKVASQ